MGRKKHINKIPHQNPGRIPWKFCLRVLGPFGPATGVFWALRAQSRKKVRKWVPRASPPQAPKSPKLSQKRVKIAEKWLILTHFRLSFGLLGARDREALGTHFGFFFRLWPEGPKWPLWQVQRVPNTCFLLYVSFVAPHLQPCGLHWQGAMPSSMALRVGSLSRVIKALRSWSHARNHSTNSQVPSWRSSPTSRLFCYNSVLPAANPLAPLTCAKAVPLSGTTEKGGGWAKGGGGLSEGAFRKIQCHAREDKRYPRMWTSSACGTRRATAQKRCNFLRKEPWKTLTLVPDMLLFVVILPRL